MNGDKMNSKELAEKVHKTLNKLCKWRSIFAGWQLGTRAIGDAECDAVRDHREVTMLLRAEQSAFTALCIKKGLFTIDEFNEQLIEEAEHLDRAYEKKFPGMKSADDGIVMNPHIAADTMRGWPQ